MTGRNAAIFSEHLAFGTLLVLAGSAVSLWTTPWLAAVTGLLVICRICWIEENIHDDLLRREARHPGAQCPVLLASEQRVQGYAWGSFAWGLAAAWLLDHGHAALFVAGLGALVMALVNADRCALGQVSVRSGRPLPYGQISGRGRLYGLIVNTRRTD